MLYALKGLTVEILSDDIRAVTRRHNQSVLNIDPVRLYSQLNRGSSHISVNLKYIQHLCIEP